MERTVFHAHGDAADALAVIAHDEVQREVLDEEEAVILQSHSVERVQDRVSSSISCCGTAIRLPALAELEALTSKGALVYFTLWCT